MLSLTGVAAQELLKQSLALSRELGDKAGISLALSRLGAAAPEEGQARRAALLFGAVDAPCGP